MLFAYLAAITTRVELMTGVLVLPQRQTALVAKQAAELAVLSEGRLCLGVGTGWNHVEYTALGTSFDDRGARFDEQIDLLRRLWREPTIDFDGKHHRIERAGLLPLPPREIPIWFGGFSKVAVRRAARVGDGFLFGTTPTRMLPLLAQLREFLAAEGRDTDSYPVEAVVDFSQTPDEWRSEPETWREAGGTHLSLRAMDTTAEFVGFKHVGYSGPGDYIRALETFMKAVS